MKKILPDFPRNKKANGHEKKSTYQPTQNNKAVSEGVEVDEEFVSTTIFHDIFINLKKTNKHLKNKAK